MFCRQGAIKYCKKINICTFFAIEVSKLHYWSSIFQVRQEHKKLTQERKMREAAEAREERRQARLFQIKDGEEFGVKTDKEKKRESK